MKKRVATVGMGKFFETSSPCEESPTFFRCLEVEMPWLPILMHQGLGLPRSLPPPSVFRCPGLGREVPLPKKPLLNILNLTFPASPQVACSRFALSGPGLTMLSRLMRTHPERVVKYLGGARESQEF